MQLNKSTRYALYAVLEMAEADGRPVTVTVVAQRYRIPESALAKVFQHLVHAGLAMGTRGAGGGYRLVRDASRLTVLEVIDCFESPRSEGQCLLKDRLEDACGSEGICKLQRLVEDVDRSVRDRYSSVTIAKLAES